MASRPRPSVRTAATATTPHSRTPALPPVGLRCSPLHPHGGPGDQNRVGQERPDQRQGRWGCGSVTRTLTSSPTAGRGPERTVAPGRTAAAARSARAGSGSREAARAASRAALVRASSSRRTSAACTRQSTSRRTTGKVSASSAVVCPASAGRPAVIRPSRGPGRGPHRRAGPTAFDWVAQAMTSVARAAAARITRAYSAVVWPAAPRRRALIRSARSGISMKLSPYL